jgi:phosphate transport system permease protein
MIWSHNTTSSPSQGDRSLFWVLSILAGLAGGIVLLIFLFLVTESLPVLHHIGLTSFFFDPSWHPVEGLYNLIPMLVGTLLVTAGAVILATIFGISSALFCQYYAPSYLASIYRKFIELLSGIPSVVFGLWGLMVLVPFIASLQPPGPSLLAGVVILTLMILPIIALVADTTLATVPREFIHGAAALGLRRWSIIRQVVLPTAKSGLTTGILLQTGRAIGETMAILMVAGNVVQMPSSIFDPIRTLTANIALEMAYAVDDHRAALFFSGLLLLTMVIGLIFAADRISRYSPHG